MATDLPGTPTVSLDARVTAVPDLMVSDLAGDMVLLNLADGVYYGLDLVGAHIWRTIASPCSVRDVIGTVMAQYDVEPQQCETDVRAFLADLAAHGLVSITPNGA